jgi:hypothetical protein
VLPATAISVQPWCTSGCIRCPLTAAFYAVIVTTNPGAMCSSSFCAIGAARFRRSCKSDLNAQQPLLSIITGWARHHAQISSKHLPVLGLMTPCAAHRRIRTTSEKPQLVTGPDRACTAREATPAQQLSPGLYYAVRHLRHILLGKQFSVQQCRLHAACSFTSNTPSYDVCGRRRICVSSGNGCLTMF